jgi:16S rRNA (cytidine1402-2'-O)-methyltransferase
MSKGKLYLIPVPLTLSAPDEVLPQPVLECAKRLTHFVAESAKSARAFLKSLPATSPLQEIQISELNEHTPESALPGLLEPLLDGFDVGLVSEAGCPAVADPGASLVALAHAAGIQVLPLIGPSSILLALMGSGLSGQNFAFHGYLPAKDEARKRKLRELELDSRQAKRTQIFIETPYRNRQMFETLIAACAPDTRICIATDLTSPGEHITTRTPAEWQRCGVPDIDRRPTVFLLQA